MNFKLMMLVLTALFLQGCASTQKEYIPKTDVKVILTPEKLLKYCPVTKPVSIKEYTAMTPQQREDTLAKLTVDLYKDLKVCNDQIAEIKGFQDRQVKIVEEAKEKK